MDFGEKGKVRTVPMLDNVSPAERTKNKAEGKKFGENRSYAYPKVFVGKRSALQKESDEFEPVEFDKKRIGRSHGLVTKAVRWRGAVNRISTTLWKKAEEHEDFQKSITDIVGFTYRRHYRLFCFYGL